MGLRNYELDIESFDDDVEVSQRELEMEMALESDYFDEYEREDYLYSRGYGRVIETY